MNKYTDVEVCSRLEVTGTIENFGGWMSFKNIRWANVLRDST